MVLLQQVLDLICSVSVRPISKALGNWLLLQRSLRSLEIDLCLRGHVPLSEPQVSTEHRGAAKAHFIIYIYVCVYDDDDDDDHDHDDIYVPFIVCICSTQHPRTAKCIVSTCRCMHAHTCMAVYRQTGIDASNRTAHTIPLHAIALHTVALHDHCTIPCHSIYMHILIIPQILVYLNILNVCSNVCFKSKFTGVPSISWHPHCHSHVRTPVSADSLLPYKSKHRR